MRQTFEKDGKVRSFEVTDGRVMATLQIGGEWVANPQLEAFLADGWSEYVEPIHEPYIHTYSELVEQYIREHGYPTYGAEIAIINNYNADPTTYGDAYIAYMQTRESAKEWAKTQQHKDD